MKTTVLIVLAVFLYNVPASYCESVVNGDAEAANAEGTVPAADLEDSRRRVPLFCWRALVNCRRERGHICCPNSRQEEDAARKVKKSDSRRPPRVKRSPDGEEGVGRYIDPLFGIPLAHPPSMARSYQKQSLDRRDQQPQVKQRQQLQLEQQQQQQFSRRQLQSPPGGLYQQQQPPSPPSWRPFDACPYVDCGRNTIHPCCGGNRRVALGPENAPRLPPPHPPSAIDSMLPGAFEKFGESPQTLEVAREAALWTLVAAGVAAWAWLGRAAGAVGGVGVGGAGEEATAAEVEKRRDGPLPTSEAVAEEGSARKRELLDMSSRVMLAVGGGEEEEGRTGWLPRLTKELKARVEAEGSRREAFLCCLMPKGREEEEEEKEEEEEGREGKAVAKGAAASMECYRKKRKSIGGGNRLGRDEEDDLMTLDCPSKLVYKFWISGKDPKEAEEERKKSAAKRRRRIKIKKRKTEGKRWT